MSTNASSAPRPDFLVISGSSRESLCRFVWSVDGPTLHIVNTSVGVSPTRRMTRGFLAHWIKLWLQMPPGKRPRFEVPEMIPEDLVYVPSPLFVFAFCADSREWRCWFAAEAEIDPEQILRNETATLIFTLEGTPVLADPMIRAIMSRFQFDEQARHDSHVFYWRR